MEKRISPEILDYKLSELKIVGQTRTSFAKNYLETISDFLAYDCLENTRYSSYGIDRLKIGKNARKRLYRALESLHVPRAFEKLEDNGQPSLTTPIFYLPLTAATINKLYRAGYQTFGDCQQQTILSKQILGIDGYEEIKDYIEKNNLEIEEVPLSKETRLQDLLLPKRLNVVQNDQIIAEHDAWHYDYLTWVYPAQQDGILTIADLEKKGLDEFEESYGFGVRSYLEKCGVYFAEAEKKENEQDELKRMRQAIKLLIDLQDDELKKEEKVDVVNHVKKMTKDFF